MWLRDRKVEKYSSEQDLDFRVHAHENLNFHQFIVEQKSNGAALTTTIKKEHEWKWAVSGILEHLHELYEELSMRAHFKHLNSNTIWIFITPRGCHWDREMINCAKSAFYEFNKSFIIYDRNLFNIDKEKNEKRCCGGCGVIHKLRSHNLKKIASSLSSFTFETKMIYLKIIHLTYNDCPHVVFKIFKACFSFSTSMIIYFYSP